MNYAANYQQQCQQQQQSYEYDPSSQYYDPSSQYYDPSTNNNYQYSYNTHHPYTYNNAAVVQEPNPPGVSQPQSHYYQYAAPTAAAASAAVAAVTNAVPQQGEFDAGFVPVHYQPIVQSSYGGIGGSDGRHPQDNMGAHFGSEPNMLSVPFRGRGWGRGRGRGRGHGRGHGRGRGRGRAIYKQPTAPIQDQTIPTQGPAQIQVPPQPTTQPYSSTLSTVPMPSPVQPQSAPVTPKLAWCELCRVDCNTLEILEQHKNGKKHKKKLKAYEGLQKTNQSVIVGQMEQTSTSELRSEVPAQPDQIESSANHQFQPESLPSQPVNEENKTAVEKQNAEDIQPTEASAENVRVNHFEGRGRGSKRKMRGGRGSRMVKQKRPVEPPKPKEIIPLICELCDVKCESTTVFQTHLVGKKHQSKAKRFMSHQEVLGQEILKLLSPAIQALSQQNANASTSIISQLHQLGFGALLGAPVQNTVPVNMQASTSETNTEKIMMEEGTSQQQQHLMNADGKAVEGNSDNQAVIHHPVGSSMVPQMEGVGEPITSETAVDGASVFQQNVADMP